MQALNQGKNQRKKQARRFRPQEKKGSVGRPKGVGKKKQGGLRKKDRPRKMGRGRRPRRKGFRGKILVSGEKGGTF